MRIFAAFLLSLSDAPGRRSFWPSNDPVDDGGADGERSEGILIGAGTPQHQPPASAVGVDVSVGQDPDLDHPRERIADVICVKITLVLAVV